MEPYSLKKDSLYLTLKQAIISGKYEPESRLPKEIDFCRMLGVAKVTLRSALEKLEADGLVVRVPGKGTFVNTGKRSNLILVGMIRENRIELPQNYILPGIESAASEQGFKTELCFIDYLRRLPPENALKILKKKNLYGVLLVTSSVMEDDPEVRILQQLGVPVLIVHGNYEDRRTGFGLLYVNRRQSWRKGLEYLAGKGHRRVQILAMEPDSVRGWNIKELPSLFRELGLEAGGKLLYSAPLEQSRIRAALDEMLEVEEPPTAIFCFSDFYAMEVMMYLSEKNIRIPEDIAVMGYCGYPGDTLLDPPLSTIDLNYVDIGKTAVELLASSASWFGVPDALPPLVAMPIRLVERDSTRISRKCDERFLKVFHKNRKTEAV